MVTLISWELQPVFRNKLIIGERSLGYCGKSVDTSEQCNRRALRFIKRYPNLKSQYLKTLQLLETNPSHPSLSLHPLQGKLKHLHSVSINMPYRITLGLLISDDQIILINVGDHEAVY